MAVERTPKKTDTQKVLCVCVCGGGALFKTHGSKTSLTASHNAGLGCGRAMFCVLYMNLTIICAPSRCIRWSSQ